jgi:hypothetical protein
LLTTKIIIIVSIPTDKNELKEEAENYYNAEIW